VIAAGEAAAPADLAAQPDGWRRRDVTAAHAAIAAGEAAAPADLAAADAACWPA